MQGRSAWCSFFNQRRACSAVLNSPASSFACNAPITSGFTPRHTPFLGPGLPAPEARRALLARTIFNHTKRCPRAIPHTPAISADVHSPRAASFTASSRVLPPAIPLPRMQPANPHRYFSYSQSHSYPCHPSNLHCHHHTHHYICEIRCKRSIGHNCECGLCAPFYSTTMPGLLYGMGWPFLVMRTVSPSLS